MTQDHYMNLKQLRTSVGTYFLQALQDPDIKVWGGRDGVISNLIKVWNLPNISRRYVKIIFEATIQCLKNKVLYYG